MIISKDYIIAHIPKTGGHALSLMLSKHPKFKFKFDFDFIKNHAIKKKERNIHKKFSEIYIENQKLVAVIRRLPSWIMAMQFHQSVHYKLNYKKRSTKRFRNRSYSKESQDWSKYNGFLGSATMTASSTFPDFILKSYLEIPKDKKIHWLRQEYLAKNISKLLGIKVKSVNKLHGYNYDHNISKFFFKEEIKRLYNNNPIWAELEERIYGNLL